MVSEVLCGYSTGLCALICDKEAGECDPGMRSSQ